MNKAGRNPIHIWLLIIIFLVLTGCSNIGSRISPGADFTKYGSFYVVRHTEGEIHIDEMIRDELVKVGLNANSGPPSSQPANVDVLVTYEDRWMWDITMYLLSLTIELREGGSGILLATGQSYRPSLERRPPEAMVEEIMKSIFSKEKNAIQRQKSGTAGRMETGGRQSPGAGPPGGKATERDGRFKLAIFPWKVAPGQYSTARGNTEKAVKDVLESLNAEPQVVLTHCYYKSQIPRALQDNFKDTDFLTGVDEEQIWVKKGALSALEPDQTMVIQKGREIGADLGLLVRTDRPGTGTVHVFVYLADLKKGTLKKVEYSVYHINTGDAMQTGLRRQLQDFLSANK